MLTQKKWPQAGVATCSRIKRQRVKTLYNQFTIIFNFCQINIKTKTIDLFTLDNNLFCIYLKRVSTCLLGSSESDTENRIKQDPLNMGSIPIPSCLSVMVHNLIDPLFNGFFILKEVIMELRQLKIEDCESGNIILSQDDIYDDEPDKIIITQDMLDLVIKELQKLKR